MRYPPIFSRKKLVRNFTRALLHIRQSRTSWRHLGCTLELDWNDLYKWFGATSDVLSRLDFSKYLGVLSMLPGLSNITCTSLVPLEKCGMIYHFIRKVAYSPNLRWLPSGALLIMNMPSIMEHSAFHPAGNSNVVIGAMLFLYLVLYALVV